MDLSKEQNYAFELFKQRKNLFITGPGGTGKTKLIENFVFLLAKNTLVNFKCVSDLDIKKITYQQVFKDSLFIEKETPPPKYFI